MRESVFLRALERDDLDLLHRWHNDPTLYASLLGAFRFVSRQAEEEWLRQRIAYSNQEVNLAICLTETQEAIGLITLRELDWVSRRAELGIFLAAPEQRSKGYGSSALRQMARHAFHDLGLQRLCLSVLIENTAAIRAYEKCGFQTEGVLRRHTFKQGVYHDVLIMGLCLEDWNEG